MTYHLLIFGAFPIGCMGLAQLYVVHDALPLLAFPYTGLVVLLAWRLRCPNCRARVMMQTFTILGHRVQIYSSYIRRYCDNCGHDLSGRGKAPPPADWEAGQKAISLIRPFHPDMPPLFGCAVIAGLPLGAMQLFVALTGLGTQFILPSLSESPLARPFVGLNGALTIALALAILKRHRRGLMLYSLYMGYAFALALYSLWHADVPGRTYSIVACVCLGIFVLVYGWVNRGWFRSDEKRRA
jgi:hypothetical protein